MASNMGVPKKKTDTELIFFVVGAILIVFICTWAGYVLEMTASPKHGIQWMKALDSLSEYANLVSFINAVKAVFVGNGITEKGLVIGFMGGMLLILYKLSSGGKRYHRKGSEHGSARWGNKQEKNIIADTNDFYNNVIAASDVFLVLDRKKREQNEAEKSKKKSKGKKSEKPKSAEKKEEILPDITAEAAEEQGTPENEKLTLKNVADMRKEAAKIKPMLNLNMIILGGSGTGKSRFYVKPNLMQCNTSFVVTDPSGELVQSCGMMLLRRGYKIKVFNINDMKHSSNYNPFHYLRDSSGEINSNNVIKMINVFMMNTKVEGASGGDQFWDDATRLLLSALCFLLVETGKEEEQNFANVLDLIHKAKVIEGKEEEKSELDVMFDKRKEDNPKALSVQYYEEFKQAAGKTMQSILISTTTKLQHFKLEDVRNLTYIPTISIWKLWEMKRRHYSS